MLSRIQGNIKDIVLDKSGKRRIQTAYRYIDKKNFSKIALKMQSNHYKVKVVQ